MISWLLAAALAGQPVAAAERAFAAMAQTKGQWTAFRAFAAPDAFMLLDGPQPAAPFLKDRKDPTVAVMWWPIQTITSCDGTMAFSTGPYRQRDGRVGRFLTIWKKQPDGVWKWVYDGGTEEKNAVPAADKVDAVTAICSETPDIPIIEGLGGHSKDLSFVWSVLRGNDRKYHFRVDYNTASGMQTAAHVIFDS